MQKIPTSCLLARLLSEIAKVSGCIVSLGSVAMTTFSLRFSRIVKSSFVT